MLFYLFIKELMGEAAPFSQIYHTVIDESQDYSLLQLYIVRYLFPGSSFTLLGDIYQTVNSVTTMQRYEDYEKVFGSGLVRIGLYRKGVLLAVHDDRHGTVLLQPLQYGPEAGEHVPAYHILRLPDSPGEIGVLLRYGAFLLINQPKQLLISPDDEMKSRLSVIPLLLAKGLEFDAVILFGCIRSNEKVSLSTKYSSCSALVHPRYTLRLIWAFFSLERMQPNRSPGRTAAGPCRKSP